MAKLTIKIREEGEEVAVFEHDTALPHFTPDDEEEIYAVIRAAVSHLGMEP